MCVFKSPWQAWPSEIICYDWKSGVCIFTLLAGMPRQNGDAVTRCRRRLPSRSRVRCVRWEAAVVLEGALGQGSCMEPLGQGCGLQTVATHKQGSTLPRGGFAHYVSVLPVNGGSLL